MIYRTNAPPNVEVYADPFPQGELSAWWIVVGCQCEMCRAARIVQSEPRRLLWPSEAANLEIHADEDGYLPE